MFSPNILITNHCNQACSFCFAKDLMKKSTIPREISLKDYTKLLAKIKRIKKEDEIDTIRLLGGEPTLHSQFEKIIGITLKKFTRIHLFTNGTFSPEVFEILSSFSSRISYMFNISTPVFEYNSHIRNQIISYIVKLSPITEVSLAINVNSRFKAEQYVEKLIRNDLINKIKTIRFGASNPTALSVNYYKKKDFLKIGHSIVGAIKILRKINPTINCSLDCGFLQCMFSHVDKVYLSKTILDKKPIGCLFGNLDIDTSLNSFPCYPLSSLNLFRISTRNKPIDVAQNELISRQYLIQNKTTPLFCKKCKHFGFTENKCMGPCLAYSINTLTKSKRQIMSRYIGNNIFK